MKTAKKWFMHWSHFLGWLRHNFKLCEVIKINIRGRHHSTVVIIMTEKSMTWANLYFIYTYDDLRQMYPVLITVLVLVRTKHQFDCAIFHSCTVGSYKCQYKRQTPQQFWRYHDWKKGTTWSNLYFIYTMVTWKFWFMYLSLCWYWLGKNTGLTVPYCMAVLWEVINTT